MNADLVSSGESAKVTSEERTRVLDNYILTAGQQGWRVASQSPTSAQLLKGKPTNHVLHLILTLVTLGAWAIVWILVSIFGGQKQQLVTVDEYGRVHTS
jgi:hypothetical protein